MKRVRISMAADLMPFGNHLLQQLRMPVRKAAKYEECRLCVMISQRGKHLWSDIRVRPVINCQGQKLAIEPIRPVGNDSGVNYGRLFRLPNGDAGAKETNQGNSSYHLRDVFQNRVNPCDAC